MRTLRELIVGGLCFLLVLAPLDAQQQVSIAPERPQAPFLWRPYLPVTVPPVRLSNSDRLRTLIRAGKLYLTAQDAVALALENNIDIEIARYNEPLLQWNLERAQAGGALPGVPSASSQTQSIQNGQGVLGSQQAAGVTVNGGNLAGNGSANATVAQIGPVTANLDPAFQESTAFSHRTAPQPNVVQSVTPVLIQGARNYSASMQQGFLTGGVATITYANHYLNENAPTDTLNPSVAPTLGLNIRHSLLQGFGIAVNSRTITVAKRNLADSDLNFRTQVERTVANVLNVYYALVAGEDDVKAKETALETAQRFYEESRRRLELGALAQLDVTTAQNQVALGQQALINSRVSRRQQELQLKNLMSKTGANDPLISEVEIVPLDRLTVPAEENIPPIPELARTALARRSDLLAEREALKNQEISDIGTKNGLLPNAQTIVNRSTAGLAGVPRVVRQRNGTTITADPYLVGGMGTALGQMFRQNYPTESIGAFMQVQTKNRQAQADYAVDQLSLRQQQLITARDMNQAQVDISNSVVALRQSRARYDAAVQNRILQQQLYEAEEKRFNLGASTPYNVVAQQRDLATAQASELSALATYQSARIGLDQTTGTILEQNHIMLAEAKSGRIARESTLPQNLPTQQ